MSRKKLAALFVASFVSVAGFAHVGSTYAADMAPKMTYEVPMPKDAFFSPLGKKTESECNQLYHLLHDPVTMYTPEKHVELLKNARPILLQYRADFDALAALYPSMAANNRNIQQETTQRLALLGDENTLKMLQAEADGPDVEKSLTAKGIMIDNAWTMADGNTAKQTVIVDQLDALDHAHPESAALTTLTLHLSTNNTTHELHERLQDMGLSMNNPAAAKLSKLKKIRNVATEDEKLKGKPFALTGKTPDGKPFTTADWKGKIVMVDFWATWCEPCKAQLPTIEKLYVDNHDKGLEIVSVSNDFSIDALKKYTAENHMPWPELFDADAASHKTWNPVTLDNGVDALPHVMVIDRNGNLITAYAGTKEYKGIVEKALADN